MWKQSVWSSLIATSVAAHHLKEGGLLTLTGAFAALQPTPGKNLITLTESVCYCLQYIVGMIGYGVAKSAVHHLTKSVAEESGGLPSNSCVLSILPITLDTPMNRKWMPKADFSTWTPLEFVAEYNFLILNCCFSNIPIFQVTT